jgi:hypothetical protein
MAFIEMAFLNDKMKEHYCPGRTPASLSWNFCCVFGIEQTNGSEGVMFLSANE